MSFYFKLKSHPKKLLYHHLKNVGEISKKIVLSKEGIKDKELLSEISYLIGISHDFAKSTTYFQEYLKTGIKTERAYHGRLSSIFGYYLIKKFTKFNNTSYNISLISWLVIMKHHLDLEDLMGTQGELEKLNDLYIEKEKINNIRQFHLNEVNAIYSNLSPIEINLEEFFEEFEDICKEIKKEGEKIAFESNIKNYFLILFLYSVLLDSDKLDASEIDFEKLEEERKKWINIPSDLVDRYKKVKFTDDGEKINIVRNDSYKEIISRLKEIEKNLENERIFSIELPTGFGKTLTVLSFALKLRHIIKSRLGTTPRIIYSLPFLSIIDQNVDVFSEVLAEYAGIANWKELLKMNEKEKREKLEKIPSSLLLKHHHLIDIKYITSEEELEDDPSKSLLLIEGWHSEIIMTTFVQFFHSLITNRNKAARKFHNMANSIIILDEVQSIPYEYWLLVKEALKHLVYNYNSWLILMTATQPFIFKEDEIIPLIKDKNKYFGKFNRVKYLINTDEIDFDEFKKNLLNEILESNKNIGIVVNTINASKDLYKFLKDELKKIYGEPKNKIENEGLKGILEFKNLILINLSTHILPIHRIERIRYIKNSNDKRKIIVTTQLIEAGVDIDLDIIYRDMAPFDCIIQTGGRCNRNNEKNEGVLKILHLKDNNRTFSRIYDSTLIGITKEIFENLKNKQIGEKEIGLLIPEYFKKVLERGAENSSKENIEAMERLMFSTIGKFQLITDEEPKIDIFVDINKESSEIWKNYKEIRKIKDKYKRRNEFLKIRNKFYNFIISVPKKEVEEFLIEPYLGYITEKNYDMEIGYKSCEKSVWII
ncbi:MAG: CRISPR-associated helicase Cas3' [Caldisericia bacterium]|nr:CRISPR-associated helicase Cas3' [Caldisericia bacterium]